MSTPTKKRKSGLLLFTILATAIVTSIVIFGAMTFLGYIHFAFQHEDMKVGDSDNSSETTGYSCGMHPWVVAGKPGNCPICGMNLTPKRDQKTDQAADGEKKIAYWRAPMNPMEIYDKPGKSAMGMDLVPVYENELSGGVEIKIDPVTQQDMGIRVATVEKGPLTYTIRTYAHITYDETRKSQINPKVSGWLEKIYVDFAGQMVEEGEPLFDIYSPDLITAQEDYLEAYRNFKKNPTPTNKKIRESVMQRLTFYDISENEIKHIEKKGAAIHALTIRSPFKGVVTQKLNAVEGAYVKAGSTVYEIADLSKVWAEAHIYEYELSTVKKGLRVEMTLPYLPGKRYFGKISYVYPYLQRKTRDVVIRIEFDNPNLELKPDMYANVFIKTSADKEGIIVPSEAVIRSGERNVLFVTRGDGKFMPRDVTLGMSVDNAKVQVLKGVAPGETVVTSGEFLLDSESKLKEATQKMLEPKPIKNQTEAPAADKSMDKGMNPDMNMKPDMKKDASKSTGQDDFFKDMEN